MKNITVMLCGLFLSSNALSDSESLREIISNLDKPYAITQLEFEPVQCVWTKNDHGELESENPAFEGSGLCWDTKAIEQAKKLERNGMLKWNTKPREADAKVYIDIHNACFYGYMGKATGDWDLYLAKKYGKLVGKYRGRRDMIQKFGRAFDYGKNVAKSPSDCRFVTDNITANG